MAKVEHTSRQVIDNKLLAALDDEEKVAIVTNEDDVELLIDALSFYAQAADAENRDKAATFIADLMQLKREAF